jgi:hypothetical protein
MLAWGKPTERQRALAQPQVYLLLKQVFFSAATGRRRRPIAAEKCGENPTRGYARLARLA